MPTIVIVYCTYTILLSTISNEYCVYTAIMATLPHEYCIYRGADKSLARLGKKQATATEDVDIHVSYL